MCVILHKQKDVLIDENDVIDAYHSNPDGCGIMYQDKGRVVTEKGIWDVFYLLERLYEIRHKEYVLHLRVRTHGDVDQKNCHPFYIGSGGYMMHNGILSVKTPHKAMSDTWHFSKMIKKAGRKLDIKDYNDIERFHGINNRMIFMYNDEIERTGQWDLYDDNYWSNLYWQFSMVSKCTGNPKYVTTAWDEKWDNCQDDFDNWYYKDV